MHKYVHNSRERRKSQMFYSPDFALSPTPSLSKTFAPLAFSRSLANLSTIGISISIRSPLLGCVNPAPIDCKKSPTPFFTLGSGGEPRLSRAAAAASQYKSSPTIGEPILAQCTRSWCVLPVSARQIEGGGRITVIHGEIGCDKWA